MPSAEGEVHILVGLTGSVASVKAPQLISLLQGLDIPHHSVKVEVVTTQHAKHFYSLPSAIKVWEDVDEWSSWRNISDKVLHIELRRWADVLVIAPIDANSMAKVCVGICDNLLTCTVRAWDLERPLLFAPAMNTHMYEHPLTRDQILRLQSFGYIEIPSIAKKLACGDTGLGAMAEPNSIAQFTYQIICDRVLGRSWNNC